MTDREAAAGLVERLLNPQWVWSHEFRELDRVETLSDLKAAATLITALLSELERVGKERDEAVSWNWALAENVKVADAYALNARALVAEAVRVVTELADAADHMGDVANLCMGDDAIAAARAFIDRVKESRS
ncbi:hypothetical protein AB4037_23275 [Labrys sp. KB_33_2]|uniref:hypothetical protein n=1 Tax=Labrys sp. KB_33_2 TaxID=3237479 RepID=UPI003F91C459